MTGGNWKHILQRAARISADDAKKMTNAMNGIIRRIKTRNMPQGPWYRTITDGNITIGHICGQGCYLSTILGSNMTPRGTKI